MAATLGAAVGTYAMRIPAYQCSPYRQDRRHAKPCPIRSAALSLRRDATRRFVTAGSSRSVPSIIAHAVAGAALGSALWPQVTRRVWVAAAVCAAIPDIDALGRPFGNLAYESAFGGHRGITHSLAFAIILGVVVSWTFFRGPEWSGAHVRLWIIFALATASHGALDALSTIGNGVAFLAPVSWSHYEFRWQPLGEIGPGPRGPARIVPLMANELLWVGLPSLILVVIAHLARRRH